MVREVLGTPGPAPPLRAEVEAGAVAEALSGDGVSAPVLRRRAAGLVVGAAGAGEVPGPAGSAIVGMAPAEAAEAADLCQDTRTEECREEWFDAAVPRRVVEVPGFFVDRTEVTHGDYARCVEAGGCAATGVIGVDVEPELPVTDVTLEDARRYCRWAGKRLPTEVEWEKAARGSDGRHYPWGNLTEDDCARAAWGRGPLAPLCKGHGDNSPAAVGDFPRGASPYGALDMAGNVWEWVEPDPRTPLPPDMGVARGGAYYLDAAVMRSAFRLFQESEERYAHTGFRCARSFAPAPPVSAPPASAPPGPDQGK
jgi:formylglycine-generating enzyme required for sulfatase activity